VASTFGAVTDAFRFWHWQYEGGGRLEVLEPAGADGFPHRFLAQRATGGFMVQSGETKGRTAEIRSE